MLGTLLDFNKCLPSLSTIRKIERWEETQVSECVCKCACECVCVCVYMSKSKYGSELLGEGGNLKKQGAEQEEGGGDFRKS